MKKAFFLMAAALVAAAGSAVDSAAFDIDPSAGAVTRSFGEPVALGYDSQWTGSGWSGSDSATVVVYAEPKAGACVGHGTVYLIGSSSSPVKGRGQLKWTPPYSGTWTLHHKVTDGGGVVFDYAIVVTVTPGGGSYTVRFHYNVASSSPTKDQTFQVGETKSLLWKDSQLGWSRAGYEFLGWATASASGFAKYVNGQKVTDLAEPGKTIHLYAVWYGGASYRVMYHRNYTSSDTTTASHRFWNGDSSQLAWKDSQLGWSNPSGKTFLGWAETAGATKATWANGATVSKLTTQGKTIHLYAVWMPNGGFPPYTVRFHYNVTASSPTKDQTFKVGETKSLLWKDSQLGWSRAGYEFLGWATASASGFAKYVNGQKVTDLAEPGKTIHLYAVWYGGASYRVMYHRNYTSSDTTTASHRFWNGDSSQLAWKDSQLGWSNPSGKTFLGWAETAGATKATWANGATVSKLTTQGKTIHLYAVWSAKKAAAAVAMAGTGTQGTSGTADAGLGAGTYAALALVDGVPVPITVYVYADGLAWAKIDDEIFIGMVGDDGAGELLGAGGAVEIVPL